MLFHRRDAWREDGFEVLGTVMVDGGEIFVGDETQFAIELLRHGLGAEARMLAHDRLDRVDVIGDQLRRYAVEIRRMFDDAAEAFGAGAGDGITEGCGIALDVVRGTKQFVARGRR